MNKEFASLSVRAVDWRDNKVILLDQRRLPHAEEYIECRTVRDVFDSIKFMVVRGAPAIGICAAYGVVLSALNSHNKGEGAHDQVLLDIEFLRQARPTAVNLGWALDEMKASLLARKGKDICIETLIYLARTIHNQDIENNLKMGRLACSVFKEDGKAPFSVMTHCNAGSLATGGYGTALGAIRSAWQEGLIELVYADETRPWFQGSRLTVWELMKDGIPVTLNVEGAASWIIKNQNVKWIIVGADRIAANGDVVNKIGTYSLAIQARFHGAKVMVVAPSSTVDMDSLSGDDIDIEMRDLDELRMFNGAQISSPDVSAINPVFDVTPAELIDCIITEKGVITNPILSKMHEVFCV